MLTTLIEKVSDRLCLKSNTQLSIISILAVTGPVIILIAGIWDAINHIQNEPEFFWSDPHIVVYAGVTLVGVAALFSVNLLIKNSIQGILKRGLQLVIIGSIIQFVSGFGDSISHDMFGIDGLLSLTHQPLEIGIVLSALGGFLIVKSRQNSNLEIFLPFAIVTFLLMTAWLAFNFALYFGHYIQCMPIHLIFSSGCAIL
ncbi:MAG: Uncharacterised protein [Candidatus Nitrosopelagicus brevis]|jgi:hypothetical protein|uniref:DUF998 domain-containing protein n=1 Tax=Candidatus Nitrosopelagicus brevis TaxID=1410606 RepID=A0A0A7UZ63_9ARCH|nr:hypothetical protein [Candidatus Nitrosopelagicus brevis]MCH2617570.1 hypothetical protein [Candidatus Nitrosopelagicus sp.]MEC7708041.1 hypothetical protein [Thermoproteota archaeon]AJA91913.1 hypothetical protein T478_0076 [Candidatus Nitrosopelagicus brevis]MEC8529317.1 hypothetical protein [Thermoproteota archaeon]MEC9416903.1 hypothetical protein [Thermoproteota archaeon]|tara:strand:- start:503 stop:1102 length:600 start_codon:yes stop_codon:yes gene_type:complete